MWLKFYMPMYASDLRLLTDDKKDVGECINRLLRATSPEREKIQHGSFGNGTRWEGFMSPAQYRSISVDFVMPFQALRNLSFDGIILKLSASSHAVILPE